VICRQCAAAASIYRNIVPGVCIFLPLLVIKINVSAIPCDYMTCFVLKLLGTHTRAGGMGALGQGEGVKQGIWTECF
jgi:hypothetical protein